MASESKEEDRGQELDGRGGGGRPQSLHPSRLRKKLPMDSYCARLMGILRFHRLSVSH